MNGLFGLLDCVGTDFQINVGALQFFQFSFEPLNFLILLQSVGLDVERDGAVAAEIFCRVHYLNLQLRILLTLQFQFACDCGDVRLLSVEDTAGVLQLRRVDFGLYADIFYPRVQLRNGVLNVRRINRYFLRRQTFQSRFQFADFGTFFLPLLFSVLDCQRGRILIRGNLPVCGFEDGKPVF